MEINNKDILTISHYLVGRTSETETQEIKERIAKDADFADAVAQYEQIYMLLQEKEDKQLLSDLDIDYKNPNQVDEVAFQQRVKELRFQLKTIQNQSEKKKYAFF